MNAGSGHVPMPGATAVLRRTPAWSGGISTRMANRTPPAARPVVLGAIKGIHTAIFFGVAAQIAVIVWDGLRQRPRRRTAVAFAIALGESAVYASNNQVCPLTPLAEQLGARSGAVTDIFLPDRISRRIPLVSGSALLLGLCLNLVAWLRDRRALNP